MILLVVLAFAAGLVVGWNNFLPQPQWVADLVKRLRN